MNEVAGIILSSGAVAVAAAKVHQVGMRDMNRFQKWLEESHNAGMAYMQNHLSLRANPSALLENAKSIICIAFNYRPTARRDIKLPNIASYAYGADYHDALRNRLSKAVTRLFDRFGGEYRICIDSAPLLERYWAEESGLGKRAANGMIAIPGYGTEIFLAEILTTVDIKPFDVVTKPIAGSSSSGFRECINCGNCRKACPAGALQGDSTVDARRCLSYLTIEHRGDWDETGERAMATTAGKNTLFGCDICQRVCPLNNFPGAPACDLPEFRPREEILTIDSEDFRDMQPEDFSRIFKGSPIKRAKLSGLKRNARL